MNTIKPSPGSTARYFEEVGDALGPQAATDPVCLYLEVTNRCNLLCATCPRTFEELEPPADMNWDLFTRIVDQVPNIARVVLHGVGEPMLVQSLPRMVAYLKARGAIVLFNSNATALTRAKGRELIDCGLDELRVSLDAADRESFLAVRGKDMFDRICQNLRRFIALRRECGAEVPRVSLWLTGLKETIGQLKAFVTLARELDIGEVYLQRLVFFPDEQGLARARSSLFEGRGGEEARLVKEAESLAASLGIAFNASGATAPTDSLRQKSATRPWSLCRRPWTLMYLTAHGRALPCCIAPFSFRGYDALTLGDGTRTSLRDIWNGEKYRAFRTALAGDRPPPACANCGLRWSL
jgi:MoaA/NifB/PqqE/SkfB family radical SAM enzyme